MSSEPVKFDAHKELFHTILQSLYEAQTYFDVMPKIEKFIHKVLGSERLTVYQRNKKKNTLVSQYKTGDVLEEICVSLGFSSIAGYVAMSQQDIMINDVYDKDELANINKLLKFNSSFDKESGFTTGSMIVIPIKLKGNLLGVFQVMNSPGGRVFSKTDFHHAQTLSNMIAQKFYYDLRVSSGPYDYLIELEYITEEHLEKQTVRAEIERRNIVELLCKEDGIPRAMIAKALEQYYQVPFMAYDPLYELPLPEKLGAKLDYFKDNLWIPVNFTQDSVTIVIDDPNDKKRLKSIRELYHYNNYIINLSFPSDILEFADAYTYRRDKHKSKDLGLLKWNPVKDRREQKASDVEIEEHENAFEELLKLLKRDEHYKHNDAVITNFLNELINTANDKEARTIYLEPNETQNHVEIRLKTQKASSYFNEFPLNHYHAVIDHIKLITKCNPEIKNKPQTGKCIARYKDKVLRIHVNTLPNATNEIVTLNIIRDEIPTLKQIELPENILEKVTHFCQNPQGLMIVAGPEHSGKTTSMHSILKTIDKTHHKILSLEDPLKYIQEGVTQVEVKPQYHITADIILNAFLSIEPNVVLINRCDEQQVVNKMMQLLAKNITVLTGICANSFDQLFKKLHDLGMNRENFAASLNAILFENLTPILCHHCKREIPITGETKALLEKVLTKYQIPFSSDIKLGQAKGCDICDRTGQESYFASYAYLQMTDEVRAMINSGLSAEEIYHLCLADNVLHNNEEFYRHLTHGNFSLKDLART